MGVDVPGGGDAEESRVAGGAEGGGIRWVVKDVNWHMEATGKQAGRERGDGGAGGGGG